MTPSARDHLQGTIEECQLGDVLPHVTTSVADGIVASVVTRCSAEEMKLQKGDSGHRGGQSDGSEDREAVGKALITMIASAPR